MEPRLSGITVLVVEDEPLIAWELAMGLEEAGASVVGPVATVDAALAKVAVEPLAAAVLDVRLGASEVTPVAHALAERGVPFVFHTGHADRESLSHWPHVPVLRKPAQLPEVVGILRALLNSR